MIDLLKEHPMYPFVREDWIEDASRNKVIAWSKYKRGEGNEWAAVSFIFGELQKQMTRSAQMNEGATK